jgi:hypothetical protein
MVLKTKIRAGDIVFIPSNTGMFRFNKAITLDESGYATHFSKSAEPYYGIVKDLDDERYCNVMVFDKGYWFISPTDLVIYEGDKNDKVS